MENIKKIITDSILFIKRKLKKDKISLYYKELLFKQFIVLKYALKNIKHKKIVQLLLKRHLKHSLALPLPPKYFNY